MLKVTSKKATETSSKAALSTSSLDIVSALAVISIVETMKVLRVDVFLSGEFESELLAAVFGLYKLSKRATIYKDIEVGKLQ